MQPAFSKVSGMKGRPAKPTTNDRSTITLKIDGGTKNRIVTLADGYGMTITEYLLTLVERDARQTP